MQINVLSKSKTFLLLLVFCWRLEGLWDYDENSKIRIHTKMSWIRSNAFISENPASADLACPPRWQKAEQREFLLLSPCWSGQDLLYRTQLLFTPQGGERPVPIHLDTPILHMVKYLLFPANHEALYLRIYDLLHYLRKVYYSCKNLTFLKPNSSHDPCPHWGKKPYPDPRWNQCGFITLCQTQKHFWFCNIAKCVWKLCRYIERQLVC